MRSSVWIGLMFCGCAEPLPHSIDASEGSPVDIIDHPNVSCTDWHGDAVCRIRGQLRADLHLFAAEGVHWVLDGKVVVGDGRRASCFLTVDPGVTVFGDSRSQDTVLVIARGSQILAQGTAEAPIVFTSSLEPELRRRGSWGGLVINGRAPINQPGGVAQAEGDAGPYGGSDEDDSSGVLEYVRVEYAGRKLSNKDELNGISFGGVGRGTVVDHVQVHMSADDGVEFYGGTVEVRHLVVTGVGDDSVDWTEGWTGSAQHALLVQADDAGERALEGDSLTNDPDASPRSHPVFANVTFVGCGEECQPDVGGSGVLLRRGTAGEVHNSILVGAKKACVDLDGAETYAQAIDGETWSSDLQFRGTVLDGCGGGLSKEDDEEQEPPFSIETWLRDPGFANRFEDPGLDGWWPDEGSPSLVGALATEDERLEPTDHIGAFGTVDWTDGWTVGLDRSPKED